MGVFFLEKLGCCFFTWHLIITSENQNMILTMNFLKDKNETGMTVTYIPCKCSIYTDRPWSRTTQRNNYTEHPTPSIHMQLGCHHTGHAGVGGEGLPRYLASPINACSWLCRTMLPSITKLPTANRVHHRSDWWQHGWEGAWLWERWQSWQKWATAATALLDGQLSIDQDGKATMHGLN